jgi:DNA invertase Pin-like site-specific DNA recombinase
MRFTFDKRWTVDFTNQFTQQRVRTLHFTDPEKVRDIAQRGKALLMESGVEFVAVDMPEANRFVVHIMAAVAEQEAEAISKRTKSALAAAKARGTQLGGRRVTAERFAEIGARARQAKSIKAAKSRGEILPLLQKIKAAGATTLRQIAAELNARGETTQRGGQWSAVQIQRILGRGSSRQSLRTRPEKMDISR